MLRYLLSVRSPRTRSEGAAEPTERSSALSIRRTTHKRTCGARVRRGIHRIEQRRSAEDRRRRDAFRNEEPPSSRGTPAVHYPSRWRLDRRTDLRKDRADLSAEEDE